MTLADLLKAAESGFASVGFDSKREGMEVSSGGPDVPGDATLRTEPACLYATQELAYAAWLRQFDWVKDCEGHNRLIWVEKPYIETYRITLGDSYGTYRVVRDRYVARGTVAFEDHVPESMAEPEVPLPAEVLGKPKRKAKAA